MNSLQGEDVDARNRYFDPHNRLDSYRLETVITPWHRMHCIDRENWPGLFINKSIKIVMASYVAYRYQST